MSKKNIVMGLSLIAVLALLYGYLYEFPVRALSTEFELSNLEVINDTVIVEVNSMQPDVIFKRVNFDKEGSELQLRIEKIRNKSFRRGSGYGYFKLNGHDGFMDKIDRIVIKYEDMDVEIWSR